jgi:transposase, IS30 family
LTSELDEGCEEAPTSIAETLAHAENRESAVAAPPAPATQEPCRPLVDLGKMARVAYVRVFVSITKARPVGAMATESMSPRPRHGSECRSRQPSARRGASTRCTSSSAEIARAVGRHRSTVGREIGRCGGRRHYRPLSAERSARGLACRPKETKLSRSPRLVMVVEAGLEKRHLPQQISARLKVEHPEDPEVRISHETIYLSLYVQSRGELRRELAAGLRSGRTRRRPHGRLPQPDWITGRVSISERPPEIQDRAVPGHWEGDLIVGAANRSFVVTLVERQTRYVMLARLGREHDSERVIGALKGQVGQLPSHLARSLTWDQGAELRLHQRFSRQSGMQVYFCDPRSPWQRGSNENTNGLLRQCLPKGSDLAVHSQADLDAIAAELNERPRQTLGWMTPAEKMAELLGEVSPTA